MTRISLLWFERETALPEQHKLRNYYQGFLMANKFHFFASIRRPISKLKPNRNQEKKSAVK